MSADTRRFTVGGSDVAAAAGIHPHVSPVMLWLVKTGRVEAPVTEAMTWGTTLEPVIRGELVERGWDVIGRPRPLSDPEHDWMTGNLDGLTVVDGRQAVLECKTAGTWAHRAEWGDDLPPVQYAAQAQWYMMLAGLDRAVLAVLVGGQRLDVHTILRDTRAIRLLREAAIRFRVYLVDDVPPPPDGSESSGAALAELYPSAHGGERVRLMGDDWQACRELSALRGQRETLDEQIAERENRIKAALGSAEVGVSPADVDVVRWANVKTTRIDTKALRRDRPDVAGEYATTTATRRFTTLREG